MLIAISEKGREEISDSIYSDWGSAVHNTFENHSVGEDVKLHKVIMATTKDTSDSTKSRLRCVYSVTLSDSSMEAPTVCCFGVNYRNLTVDADGNLPDEDLRYNTRTHGYIQSENRRP
mgnify:CR=1 FL=1